VAKSNGRPKLLTRVVKGIGHWLGPETPTGKVFVAVEKGATKAFDRVGRSDLYLNLVGRMLNSGLRARAMYVSWQEDMLHAMRLPTATEMDDLREQMREMHDQMEAVSSQLEVVLEALEGQRHHQHKPETRKDGAT
jgi:hypothetical protein